MTSYIISSPDKKQNDEYVSRFLTDLKIDRYDITTIGREDSKNLESIGIEEIKKLQSKIFLKPINSEKKAIIINDAEFLTIEAQNSLLKVLEEPPSHTIIILTAKSIESLISTIISRCQIVELRSESRKIPQDEKIEAGKFIEDLSNTQIGDLLKKSEDLTKDKDKTLNLISNIIAILREKVLEKAHGTRDTSDTLETISAIKSFQSLYILLKTTNTNPRLAIENTLLNL